MKNIIKKITLTIALSTTALTAANTFLEEDTQVSTQAISIDGVSGTSVSLSQAAVADIDAISVAQSR